MPVGAGEDADAGRGPLWPPVVGVSTPVPERAPQRGRPQGPPPLVPAAPAPTGHQACSQKTST